MKWASFHRSVVNICAPLMPSASTITPACGRSSVIPKTRTSPSPTVFTSTWWGASAASKGNHPEPATVARVETRPARAPSM